MAERIMAGRACGGCSFWVSEDSYGELGACSIDARRWASGHQAKNGYRPGVLEHVAWTTGHLRDWDSEACGRWHGEVGAE